MEDTMSNVTGRRQLRVLVLREFCGCPVFRTGGVDSASFQGTTDYVM